MRICYLTMLEYPSTLANRMQVIKMSEAFARLADVCLFVSALSDTKENVLKPYGVTEPFEIREIPRVAVSLWPKSYWAAAAYKKIIDEGPADSVFYIRDILLAFFLTMTSPRFCKNYFFELHSLEKFPAVFYRRVFQQARGIISTNHAKKEVLIKNFGVPEKKVHVAPNGFDARLFEGTVDRTILRRELGLPEEKKIVLYAGSMQDWKGADIVSDLARRMPDICFVVVGADHDWKKENIQYVQKQFHGRVPLYLAAADLLLAPYRGDDARVELYFSPIKIFEYMASGTPMVVSDVPAIREVVFDESALFAHAGDARSFQKKVQWAFGRPEEIEAKAHAAKAHARKYSWDERARGILEFIQSRS